MSMTGCPEASYSVTSPVSPHDIIVLPFGQGLGVCLLGVEVGHVAHNRYGGSRLGGLIEPDGHLPPRM
jgi:hypothetical protein